MLVKFFVRKVAWVKFMVVNADRLRSFYKVIRETQWGLYPSFSGLDLDFGISWQRHHLTTSLYFYLQTERKITEKKKKNQ